MRKTPIQTAAALVAAAFLAVGVLGFIPGITTDYDRLSLAGHEGAKLLGLFEVNVLHSLVHVAFGIVGLALARSFSGARGFLIGGGLVYLAVTVYGAAVDMHSSANLIAVNNADNLLHLGLGLAMVLIGVVLGWRTRLRAQTA
jgi:Domain of unknown function (DUF4383)